MLLCSCMAATAQRPITLPKAEQKRVEELEAVLSRGKAALVSSTGERIEFPNTVYDILRKVVSFMAHGQAITLVPTTKQLPPSAPQTCWECHDLSSLSCSKPEPWHTTASATSDECICATFWPMLRSATKNDTLRSIVCREQRWQPASMTATSFPKAARTSES